ncbi:MAG: hypothetical protein CM15mP103_10470 [Gammaproteobacteria bacterium]|nr:MAG: hypothetical protein CM15mP103_10470 [Gammaproteobacteria bacterium]
MPPGGFFDGRRAKSHRVQNKEQGADYAAAKLERRKTLAWERGHTDIFYRGGKGQVSRARYPTSFFPVSGGF